MLNVTTARAAAKETKFEYEQCYVVDVVSELCGPESQLGYQNVTSSRDNKTYCPISDFAVSADCPIRKGSVHRLRAVSAQLSPQKLVIVANKT